MGDVLLGVQSEKVKLDDVAPVFDKFSATIEDVVAGRPANFSWQTLVRGGKTDTHQLRGFIDVRPILDYQALEPGHAATETIRSIAAGIAPKYQATVRLTGPVATSHTDMFRTIDSVPLKAVVRD